MTQALTLVSNVSKGQRVLILGASGGVGSMAVQLAKHLGAHVIGVCSGRNAALVRSLGADEVVDYTTQSVGSAVTAPVDVVLDLVGGTVQYSSTSGLIKAGGRFVSTVGDYPEKGISLGMIASVLKATVTRSWPFTSHSYRFMSAEATVENLTE